MQNSHGIDLRRYNYRLLAALTTWIVVSLAYLSPVDPTLWDGGKWTGLAALLLYGAAIYIAIRNKGSEAGSRLAVRHVALGVAALALLVAVLAHSRDIIFILAIIFAAILPEFFSFRRSVAIQLALHTTLTIAYALRWGGTTDLLVESLLWLSFQAFALLSSQIAAEERRAREELQFSHGQLAATQDMLASTSRQDERLRISRDIHDVMGHHLTGLSLQLEVASHSAGEKVQDHIARAQLIAKLLLSDVRQVVNDLRETDVMELGGALESLTANTGRMQVELNLPEQLQVHDNRLGEAVFRTVQEIVTNAVRHSGASRLVITLTQNGEELGITASDNGRLKQLSAEGNGLKGMRERIEALGGSLSLRAENGLSYDIRLGTALT